jgi:hypothetical protein
VNEALRDEVPLLLVGELAVGEARVGIEQLLLLPFDRPLDFLLEL